MNLFKNKDRKEGQSNSYTLFSSQMLILSAQALRSSMAQASLYPSGVVGLVEVTSDHSGWKGCPTTQGRQAECQPAIATQ